MSNRKYRNPTAGSDQTEETQEFSGLAAPAVAGTLADIERVVADGQKKAAAKKRGRWVNCCGTQTWVED